MDTHKPAFDDGLFAKSPHGLPVSGTTPAEKPAHIDLELDDTLKSFLLALGNSPAIENLRLIGPAGCGKTSIGQWLAQETNKRLLIMDCSVIREPRDWFGFRTVHNGTIQWQDTEFVRTLTTGNCVIVLDELNRAPASVLNGLMPLLDHRRFSWVEERGSAVRVGPNTTFVATTNIGAKYLGASPVDLALRDRFSRVIEVSYLPTPKESELLTRRTSLPLTASTALATIAANTRGKNSGHEPISTRELLAAASDIVKFGEQSLRYTILSKIDDHSKRAAMATLLAGKFPGLVSDTATLTTTEPF
jgi:MoxR-like ATPase